MSRVGITLLECLIASVFLAVAVVGLASSLSSGVHVVTHASDRIDALQLAEQMLDEMAWRSPESVGGGRPSWGADDYNGFTEEPGTLTDAAGVPYPDRLQAMRRRVVVSPAVSAQHPTGLAPIQGRDAEVTVQAPAGWRVRLVRFFPTSVAQ